LKAKNRIFVSTELLQIHSRYCTVISIASVTTFRQKKVRNIEPNDKYDYMQDFPCGRKSIGAFILISAILSGIIEEGFPKEMPCFLQ
jgi:hypothetical protein